MNKWRVFYYRFPSGADYTEFYFEDRRKALEKLAELNAKLPAAYFTYIEAI